MNVTFLILYWLILAALTASSLMFEKYQNHQILGVTFSKEHAATSEVKQVLAGYKKAFITESVIFYAAGLLMLFSPLKEYVDFFMLMMIVIVIVVISFTIKKYQDRLITIKEEKKWIYSTEKTVSADLDASREKGKSAVSVLWSWMFVLLSFAPFVYLLFNDDARKNYPIAFSLMGPFLQLLMVVMYKQALKSKSPVISENSEINKALARTFERINTMAATLTGFVMFLFYIVFSAGIIMNSYFVTGIVAIAVMLLGIFAITIWRQKKINHAEEHFMDKSRSELFTAKEQDILEQENLWKWGWYNNPNDPRLFVPKRIAGMGWTINIAKPAGKLFMLATGLLVVGITAMIIAFSVMGYDISEKNSEVTISAMIYNTTFAPEDIISVEMLTDMPSCTRTNGYGGATKSSGHFTVSGYGPSMLYIYNDVEEYIVIHLKGDGPEYVFVNGETKDKTNELYDYFINLH